MTFISLYLIILSMSDLDLLSAMFGSGAKNTKGIFLQHPNPKFQRSPFLALNGKYNFEVNKSKKIPSKFDGFITVPFLINTEMSETSVKISKKFFYHYHKVFTLNDNFNKNNIYLKIHSYKGNMIVFINGKEVYVGVDELDATINIKKYVVFGTNSLDFTFFTSKQKDLGISGPVLIEQSL